MNKFCEYLGKYLEWNDDMNEEIEVFKCKLLAELGDWEQDCYCDKEEAKECMLYKYVKIKGDDKDEV